MPRYVITLRELGGETCWTLVKQAMGVPDAKMVSDFMKDRVALLLFSRPTLPERLCVTAAVRQMGGSTIYQGDAQPEWRKELKDFQDHLLPIFSYYMDVLYTYGFPVAHWRMKADQLNFAVINAGSPDAHPAHALADVACMLRVAKSLEGIQAAWIGRANGALRSLVEATRWFHFSLAVCAPDMAEMRDLQSRAIELGVPVSFVSKPADAVKNANFIYAGRRDAELDDDSSPWAITGDLLHNAAPGVRLLLSASPVRAIKIDPDILSSKISMLTRQAQYRLCVHKRILHWIYSEPDAH